MESNHTNSILKWTLAIAIVIIINLLFYYLIALVYPEPKYEKFCSATPQVYVDANSCVASGGQWTNNQLAPQEITKAVKNGEALGWCDPNFTCNNNYNHAHSVYNRNVFGVLIVLSILILIAGAFMSIEALSLGLSWGGVVSLIVATIRFWSDANSWMRVVILIFALALLVWLALKKFKHNNSKEVVQK